MAIHFLDELKMEIKEISLESELKEVLIRINSEIALQADNFIKLLRHHFRVHRNALPYKSSTNGWIM